MNEAMHKFSGMSYETSDQHKDTSAAMQTRCVSDTLKLITYLKEIDPFVKNDLLFNIANGMTTKEGVNVDIARELGNRVATSMAEKSVEAFTFRKVNHTSIQVNSKDQR